eukprot:SAG11_NODE_11395_length_763_cov_1.588855_1_plen_81_part_00
MNGWHNPREAWQKPKQSACCLASDTRTHDVDIRAAEVERDTTSRNCAAEEPLAATTEYLLADSVCDLCGLCVCVDDMVCG